jgi:hypothetical protein
MEFARIDFHVDDDLASWRAEIPGKLTSSAETLGGPTTPPGKRVQVRVRNRSGWHGDLRESHHGQGGRLRV